MQLDFFIMGSILWKDVAVDTYSILSIFELRTVFLAVLEIL